MNTIDCSRIYCGTTFLTISNYIHTYIVIGCRLHISFGLEIRDIKFFEILHALVSFYHWYLNYNLPRKVIVMLSHNLSVFFAFLYQTDFLLRKLLKFSSATISLWDIVYKMNRYGSLGRYYLVSGWGAGIFLSDYKSPSSLLRMADRNILLSKFSCHTQYSIHIWHIRVGFPRTGIFLIRVTFLKKL